MGSIWGFDYRILLRYSDQLSYSALFLAALSVALRPTLVVFWGVLGIHYLIHIHYADK